LSSNAPLFHRKDTVWEGGVRVPTIMRWPGRIPEGRISGQLGITMDLTATILAATNSAAGKRELDGINLLPILQDNAPEVERALFFRVLTTQRQQRAVRQGDWKLVIDGDAPRGGPLGPPMLLFNLREDIGERNDVARHHTDIVRRLYAQLAAWEAEVGAEAKMRTQKN
jgi:arylsulfatase A-like enzyme